MTRMFLGAILLMTAAAPCLAAEPAEFRFYKDIDRGEADRETIVAIEFDSDVYAATRPELPDARIFDADGRETPYLMEKVTEIHKHLVRVPCDSRVVSLDAREDVLELIVELGEKSPPADGLSILTPLNNFERRVQVFGGKDGKKWAPLVTDGLVFDYSRYFDINNRDIRLPENKDRRLKIVVTGIADSEESPFLELTRKYHGGDETERIEKTVLERRPFRMDRIELWCEKSRKLDEYDKTIEYPVVECRAEEEKDKKSTIVHVRTRREPLVELTLETPSRNFSRPATVQIPVTRGGHTEWVAIGEAKISRVDFGGYHEESMAIAFPEHRQSEYRIVIRNEDNPRLEITGVKARGNVYRAVFLAAKDAAYRLGYGAEEVKRPKYDAATVLMPLRLGHAADPGTLGKEVSNPNVVEPPTSALRDLLNNPLFLGVVVAVLVAVLGWALYRASRRINEIPKN